MKILLVTPSSPSYEPVRMITEPNKKEYCDRHSIQFFPLAYPDAAMDKGYGRPQFLLDHIEQCDWIMNMDCDAIFTNMTISAEDFCYEDSDLVASWDCMGFHSGVMFLRNCPKIVDLLRETIQARETDGKLMDFMASSDQGAMVRILSQRDKYANLIPASECQKFGVRVRECDKTINRYYGDWQDGSFAFHTPGMGVIEKCGLLKHFLRKVVK